MDNAKIRYGIYGLLVMLAALLVYGAVVYTNRFRTASVEQTGFVMGTVMTQKLYGGDASDMAALMQQIETLDQKQLSWRDEDSMLAQLNRQGTMELQGAFAGYITDSLALADASQGAFDPTLRPLIALWGIEGDHPAVPDAQAVADCLQHVGYEKVKLQGTRIDLESGMALDLGAVGKGIALDVAYAYLESRPVEAAVIAVGGSVLTYGNKPDGNYRIAIRDPDAQDGTAMGVLSLAGTHFISTSGDYEKYFEEDGVRYHHILDRRTGFPADNGVRSVTVVCGNGLDSDGLSTACFVLGYENSLPLLKQYAAEAVFLTSDGEVMVTEGLQSAFHLENTAWKVKDMKDDENEKG